MKTAFRYELLKPASIAEAEDMWVKTDEGKKAFADRPNISVGEVEHRAFAWLFERIELSDDPPQINNSLEERKVIALEKIASAFFDGSLIREPESGKAAVESV